MHPTLHPFPADVTGLRPVLDAISAELAAAGIESASVDAELLAAHVLGVSRGRVQLLSATGTDLGPEDAARLRAAVARRAAREPLQHITGTAAFRHLELAVGPGVFVPRPETESVAQIAIDAARAVPAPEPVVVDLGTGSGAIALSVATEVPNARVHAVENSPEAFIWARANQRRVEAHNARMVFASLEDALPELDGTVDVLVSNPPYIPLGAIPRDPEVRLYDPAAALYSGVDGMDAIRGVSRSGLRLLRDGGALIIEHGDEQGATVREVLRADGWRAVATHRDLTLRDRTTTAIR